VAVGRIEPTPATAGTPCDSPILHRRGLIAPILPWRCHSHAESANDLFSTLDPRVQADHVGEAAHEPLSRGLATAGPNPRQVVMNCRGRHADAADHADRVGPTLPVCLGDHADQVEPTVPRRYNQGMSATEKLAISLPKDLIEKLRRAKDEGRIDSVSGHIAELLRREDDWRDARATLDRIFERCPGPEAKHYAWARRALGVGPNPVG
jgi:hypothetical protein